MQLHVHQNKINRLIVITWNPSQLPFQHQCCLSYTVFLVTLVLYHLGKLINCQSRATVLPFHFCTHPWYTSERTAYDAGTISLFFWNDPRDYGWFLCQRWNETPLLAPTSSLLRTNFWKRYRESRKFKQEMGYKTNENKAVAWALSDAGIRDILMTTELFKQKHHIAIHKRTAVQNTITHL